MFLVPLTGFVDGGLHLNSAVMLREAAFGLDEPGSIYLEWFPFPVPNLLHELALATLTAGISPYTAELVLIAGYVVGFSLAFVYAVRGVSREADGLALFAIPVTFTFALHYGFYNFSVSVIMFLLVVGCAMRLGAAPGAARIGLLSLLVGLAYLSHLVGFVEAVVAVGVVIGWRVVAAHGSIRRLVPVFVVGAMLLAFFLFATSSKPTGFGLDRLVEVAQTLSLAWGIATFGLAEAAVLLVVAVMLLVLVIRAVRLRRGSFGLREADSLLLLVLIQVAAVVLAPSGLDSGATYVTERLALFPALTIVLWLAAAKPAIPTSWLTPVSIVLVLLSISLFVIRLPHYREISAASRDFSSASLCVARRATMIQATLHLPDRDHPSWRVDPLSDEAGRVAASTSGIDLGNVAWAVPYYVLRFKDELDPYQLIPSPAGEIEAIPPNFDLEGYERRSGRHIDYVLLTGRSRAPQDVLAARGWTNLRAWLAKSYTRVYRSPLRWVEVWERNDPRLRQAGAHQRRMSGCS